MTQIVPAGRARVPVILTRKTAVAARQNGIMSVGCAASPHVLRAAPKATNSTPHGHGLFGHARELSALAVVRDAHKSYRANELQRHARTRDWDGN